MLESKGQWGHRNPKLFCFMDVPPSPNQWSGPRLNGITHLGDEGKFVCYDHVEPEQETKELVEVSTSQGFGPASDPVSGDLGEQKESRQQETREGVELATSQGSGPASDPVSTRTRTKNKRKRR